MSALNGIINFLTNDKQMKLFKKGAQVGSGVLPNLIDDLSNHAAKYKKISDANNTNTAIFQELFPVLSNYLERSVKEIETLEKELYPTPEAEPKNPIKEELKEKLATGPAALSTGFMFGNEKYEQEKNKRKSKTRNRV
jgi:hypothetical protein